MWLSFNNAVVLSSNSCGHLLNKLGNRNQVEKGLWLLFLSTLLELRQFLLLLSIVSNCKFIKRF